MEKRILSISAQKPNSTGSGVYLTELVKAYHQSGTPQAVIAGINAGDTVELPEGVAFYPVRFQSEKLPFPVAGMSDVMPYAHTRYCDMDEEMIRQFITAFSDCIEKVLVQFQPDIILCHHLYLVTALAVECVRRTGSKAKVVGICHSTCLRQFRKNELEKERIRSRIPELHRIYALHAGQQEEICRLFDVPVGQVQIVGAGYNDGIFFPGTAAQDDTEGVDICFAGKVSQAKGVKSLLHSLAKVKSAKPVRLHLAGGNGDEAEVAEIRKLATELEKKKGVFVAFEGKLPQKELAELYRRCQLFVLPSFYEGLPLVLLEAMASGCLAVAADWPGVKEWIFEKVPAAELSVVSLPEMEAPGVPKENQLADYEERLAMAISHELEVIEHRGKQADVSAMTWGQVAAGIEADALT